MKSLAKIFLSILLIWSQTSWSQPEKVFYSLEEAAAVQPDSVFQLDLSKKKLVEVPSVIYAYKNLTHLNLSQNKLTRLPDEFYFANLKVLNLEKNDIDTFSQAFCQLTQLQHLYLGKNDIRYLPECIGNMQELVVLDIWFNPIQDLPQSMTQLKKLRSLDMRGITYSNDFQKKWNALLPWVKIEFETGCDCNY